MTFTPQQINEHKQMLADKNNISLMESKDSDNISYDVQVDGNKLTIALNKTDANGNTSTIDSISVQPLEG